jgi:DNA-binding NarL/FixJ family response regulator
MIGVGIIAAAALIRAELQQLVEADEHLVCVAAAASFDALRAALDRQPDLQCAVVLVDAQAEDSAQLCAALEAGQKLVLLSDGEPESLLPLVSAGAAWLPRDAQRGEITAAVQAVAAGLVALRGESIADLAQAGLRTQRTAEAPPIEPLTPRELEVLRLVAQGLANKRIAQALGISEHTAKFHVGSILGKLDATTRAEAVAIGLRDRLIQD